MVAMSANVLVCSEVTICIHTNLQFNFLLSNTMKVKAKDSLLVFAMLLFHILPTPTQKKIVICNIFGRCLTTQFRTVN